MENLDTIKSDPRVLDIYRERVYLKKENGGWTGKCPLHTENTGSFKLSLKDNKWLFKCFGCNDGGSIIDLVQKMDGCSTGEAVKKIREKLGIIKSVDSTFKPLAEPDKKVTVTLEQFKKLEDLLPGSDGEKWLLKERGITPETSKTFHLGYKDNQIVFPLINNGVITGIKFRSITEKKFVYQKGMENGLFNLDVCNPLIPVFITEGEVDAIILGQCGFAAVALPGASYKLKPEEKQMLKMASEIYLCGDSDAPGQETMTRLWQELKDRTYLIQWPNSVKDANQFFVDYVSRNVEGFRKEFQKLIAQARTTPMPHIQSLRESLENGHKLKLSDHPNRLRMPYPKMDKMAILLPGSVTVLITTNTKMGKTVMAKEITLHNAFHGDVVLNYGAELSIDEFSNMVAAGLLKKDRNHLTEEDNKKAGKMLGNIKYYYGRNPTLTTIGPVLDLIEAAVVRLGVTIVVLDHLHFLCRNSTTEIQDQANAMQRLKHMAQKHNLKVLVVAQPRKAKQDTKGKAIHITDIKGAESIGSDADAIFALHREYVKVKDPMNPPMDAYEPKTEVHLLGVRSKGDGPAYCELMFLGEFASFVELTNQEPPVDSDGDMW